MATLPKATRAEIEAALAKFDQELRDRPEVVGWEKNSSQKHVLLHEGKRYPPKTIISLATGLPVSQFSGGSQANRYLDALGFKVESLRGPEQSPVLPSFRAGQVYDRWPDINDKYGGSRQSGISASSQTPAIFVFTGDSGQQYGYQDHFDERGVFWYTGEGQLGDMKLTKGNRAIAEHSSDGRALHVFQTLGKAKGQRYVGEFTYASHELREGPDKTGGQRQIIVFHLVPVGLVPDDVDEIEEEDFSTPVLTLEQARLRALAAFSPTVQAGTAQAQRTLYRRSKAVKDYVNMRSRGMCESCKKPAPFSRADGSPYLEPHHTTRVSDGGLDHPRHVGAICPDCHREIHHGVQGSLKNKALIRYLESAEPL